MTEVNERKRAAAAALFLFPIPGARAFLLASPSPQSPMNSVSEREPWNWKRRKSSPDSGSVRARRPTKPMNSVSEREPPARNV